MWLFSLGWFRLELSGRVGQVRLVRLGSGLVRLGQVG